jgi:hypothetical protein
MYQRSFFLLIAVLIFSCKEISFREPQPKGRRILLSVPEKLRGKYLTFQDNGEVSKDTVVITANGYRFGYYDQTSGSAYEPDYHSGVLSDSLVLKYYRGYYFLNLYEDPEWLLRVIKQQKNGDLLYMALEQKNVDFNDYVSKLSTEIAIDSVKRKNKILYYIDPSPSKLVELIEKGYLSHAILKKVE